MSEDNISFITEPDGTETPIRVIKEIVRESDNKRFVIYTDIEDPSDDEEVEYYVAEIVQVGENEDDLEIREIESDEDMDYCQQAFDDLMSEMYADNVSDEEEDEDKDEDDE